MQRRPLLPALLPAMAFGLVSMAAIAHAGTEAAAAPAATAAESTGTTSAGGAKVPAEIVPFETEDDLFEPELELPEASPPPEKSGHSKRSKSKRSGKRDRKSAAGQANVAAPAPVPVAPEEAAARTDFDLTRLMSSPVPGVESSGFGWRADPINNRRKFHKGTDFRAPRGTPVYAAGAGVVTFAGRMGGYGNVIFIDHGGGVLSRYGHLRRLGTVRNAQVVAGAQIGEVGSTGRATGPHLHFEARLDGRAVNPSVAMSVAALQRIDPVAARGVAASLAPEVQSASVDPHRKAGKRPDRRGRGKRSKALW